MGRGTETISMFESRMGDRVEVGRSEMGATTGDRIDRATRAQTWAVVGALCTTALVLLSVHVGG